MLDKIMDLVGGDALSAITSQAGISKDQASAMLPLAQESLTEGLMSELTAGNKSGLLDLFNSAGGNGLLSNGIFNNLKGLFVKKIMSSLGLPDSIASLAAGAGMSTIIGSLSGLMRADGKNDDINLSNIVNVLGGSNGSGMLGNLLGGLAGQGGSTGETILDVAGDLMGGSSDSNNDGGNLFGSLKKMAGGFLKK